MKGDFATRRVLYAIVVLSVGTAILEGFLRTHDEGMDGVVSIHGEIKVAAPIRYGLEDLSCLPSAFSGFDLAGRVRCTFPRASRSFTSIRWRSHCEVLHPYVGDQAGKYDIHMLEIRSGSMTSICPSGLHVLPEDLPLAGTDSRICAVVRKASPSSGRVTVTRPLCCRTEGDCSR